MKLFTKFDTRSEYTDCILSGELCQKYYINLPLEDDKAPVLKFEVV